MKSNLKELFDNRLKDFKSSTDINIEEELDEIMPFIKFENKFTKAMMAREIVRGRFTSMMNSAGIYSFEKGHFVWIENATETQLSTFKDKAERDKAAAEKRLQKAEELINQISMAWDEDGNFIGYHVPKAVGE